jgi:hypothetical protein
VPGAAVIGRAPRRVSVGGQTLSTLDHDGPRARGPSSPRRRSANAPERPLAIPDLKPHDVPGLYRFPAAGWWWAANRAPLSEGFVTESLDGPAGGTADGRAPQL